MDPNDTTMQGFGFAVAIGLVLLGLIVGMSGIGKDWNTAVGRLFAGMAMIVGGAIIFVLASGAASWSW